LSIRNLKYFKKRFAPVALLRIFIFIAAKRTGFYNQQPKAYRPQAEKLNLLGI
jgi:hypothetical protein